MAKLNKGKTFGATDLVYAEDLHALVDDGSVSNIVTADIGDNQVTNDKIYSVSGAKFTNLANIPSGSGVIPDANLPVMVKTSGDQTVAGVKTFSSFPITPSSAPTTDYQVANKKYVADRIVQMVSNSTTAVATNSTVMPNDDSVPQITEGGIFMNCTITPRSTTNLLKIDAVWNGESENAGTMTMALFQDSTANALAAVQDNQVAGALKTMHLTHYMPAGTTSATTFRIGVGNSVSGTTTFNGADGNRKMGGVMGSRITVTEIYGE